MRDGKYEEAVNKYTGDYYKQHSKGVKDGKEGFIEFFSDFVKRCLNREIEIIRSWEEGRFVFVQAFQNTNHGEAKWITTDFFDTDCNDKIIEHWDVISQYYESTSSEHTSIDGNVKITDIEKTDDNKFLVKQFILNVFIKGGNPDKIHEFVSENCIQRIPDYADGRDYFLKTHAQSSTPKNYKRIHLCVGQENFIATLSEVSCKNGESIQDYAQVDIFRVENNLITEYWQNKEVIPE